MRRKRFRRYRRPPKWIGIAPTHRSYVRRLKRAHRLMELSEFPRAAKIFEQLSEVALRRDPRRAPQMLLQAGRAHLHAGNDAKGAELLLTGVRSMYKMGQLRRLAMASERILNGLRKSGKIQEYRLMEAEIDRLLGDSKGNRLQEERQLGRATLPPKCPNCGGTIHRQEVEWIDDQSARCDYCGSVVEATA